MIRAIAKRLKSQTGAVFGMDARVALIIASIMAATGGVTVLSRVERNKNDAAERGVDLLVNANLKYYITTGINTISPDIATLFTSGVMEESYLQQDPWGNNWNYVIGSTNIEIEDVPVTMWYGTIHTSGKDGTDDSVAIASYANWQVWEAAGDDIGIKFSTTSIEKDRVELYRKQGQEISDRLAAVEAAWYLDADGACTGPAWCTSGGKSYTNFSYYPISSLDANVNIQYFDAVCTDTDIAGTTSACNDVTYISGNQGSMEALLNLLNLPISYATDPWNRTLRYNSNLTDREDPPFSAQVWYQ